MALTQVPPALLTATTGTGSTVALSASPTFTGTVTTPSVTFSDASLQTAAASPYVLKNRIINGAMVIDQRNAGASITPADGDYSLDRWRCFQSPASKYSVQQNAGSVTPPTGFTNYLGATSLSAYTPTGSNYFFLSQAIEGYNIADLGFGTANAKTITLSFWVRSSLTGSFGALVYNNGYTRTYPILYTISSANTWEYKTITIAGDTSGTWLTTNGLGIGVGFCLGAGSTASAASGSWTSAGSVFGVTGQTQVVSTNGATFYITGVQLEIGTSATPFERRLYGQELINCQRYYEKSYPATVAPGTGGYVGPATVSARATINGYCFYTVPFSVEKRGTPIINIWSYNGTASQLSSFDSGVNLGAASALQITPYSFLLCNNSGGTIADGSPITINYSSSAEL